MIPDDLLQALDIEGHFHLIGKTIQRRFNVVDEAIRSRLALT